MDGLLVLGHQLEELMGISILQHKQINVNLFYFLVQFACVIQAAYKYE
jgi:hypothetical protein